jgi:hypothetical protein
MENTGQQQPTNDIKEPKLCRCCNTQKAITEFYWVAFRRDKKYYSSICKVCNRSKCREYYRNKKLKETGKEPKIYRRRNDENVKLYEDPSLKIFDVV